MAAIALPSPGESPLARLELACRLLAEARSIDEVKAIVDLAEAARVYARQARLGLDAQNDAAELRLRAERRAGELLAVLSRHPGGRPSAQENLLPPVTGFAPRLPELQITRRQSSQWQQIAGVPESVFEAHISTTRSRRHELTTASALKLARQHRPRYVAPPVPVPMHDELNPGDRFDVADAAALPWPDGQIDLIVCSPPYALDVAYAGGDVPDYAAWLQSLSTWLTECWQFRTWIVWDKLRAGAGTHRGSIDSAAAPNVTAPVESVLVFFRGSWYRSGPATMPHDAWLELCGPRGLWRFHGTHDPGSPAPFPEELPLRCITLFSFPGDLVGDPFVGLGTTAGVAARLGRTAWAADSDANCVTAARAWVARERAGTSHAVVSSVINLKV